MKTVALIQARMSSSRFPGKVIEPLHGMPMIEFMARRVRQARSIDELVVVTSTDPSDDPLVRAVQDVGFRAFRGPLDDVLERFYLAASAEQATVVVRLTGDCPLIDPGIIDAVVGLRREHDCDYASNIAPPTFPDGLDVECFTYAALVRARNEARLEPEREHVTPWMRTAESALRSANFRGVADLSHIRLTVDYPDDLRAVRRLVSLVSNDGRSFDLFDLLRGLTTAPEILALNRHERNEKLAGV